MGQNADVAVYQALFSILDHSLRRNMDQQRVIGTLLGVRSDDGTEIEIRNCFGVGHNESQEQVRLV
jgi:translation initiation factor 3 subunit F